MINITFRVLTVQNKPQYYIYNGVYKYADILSLNSRINKKYDVDPQ